MARNQRTYNNEYKVQVVKLAQEIGGGMPDGIIYCWIKAFNRIKEVPYFKHAECKPILC